MIMWTSSSSPSHITPCSILLFKNNIPKVNLMNNLITEYYKIQLDASKAIDEACKAKIPPFDPELGLSSEEFDKMINDIKASSTKAHEEIQSTLKKYEIDQ